MKIFTSAFFALSLLITPSAWAAFDKAADALNVMQNDGRPRLFDAKVYFASGDQQITIKANGASEGKTLSDSKVKMNIKIDVTEDIGTAHLDLKAVIHNQTFYLMLEDFSTGNNLDSITANLKLSQKKWIKIPINNIGEYSLYELNNLEAILPGMCEVICEVVNDLLTINHQRFSGGHAYEITLNPGAVEEDALLSLMYASLFNDFKIKVNTNNDDQFTFGKIYFSNDLSFFDLDEDFSNDTMAFEMTMQRQYSPVYVSIPTQTVSFEQFVMELAQLLEQTPPLINELMDIGELGFGFDSFGTNLEDYIEVDSFDYDDFDYENYNFEEPEDNFDYLIPGTNQTYDFYGNYCVSTSDIDRLNLQRKGICRVSNLRPRDKEREGSLSLRRQRVQAVDEQRRTEYRKRVKAIQKNARDWGL